MVQGWEFTYQQQFTFLPGLLKGLSASANYAILQTSGDFGGTVSRSTNEVPGFMPRTGNLGLAWRWRNFSARYSVNYIGRHITGFNAALAICAARPLASVVGNPSLPSHLPGSAAPGRKT